MNQPGLSETHRKALIFQRRQIQSERNIEEIVHTNTEKVSSIIFESKIRIGFSLSFFKAFYERCRDFYSPAVKPSGVSPFPLAK